MNIVEIENLSKVYLINTQSKVAIAPLSKLFPEAKNLLQRILHPRKAQSKNKFEEFAALRNVTFKVEEGDRIGIIGRNGAGKSTLLKILSRITEPTKGKVKIRGRVSSLLEVGTGFHPELSGRENIFLNGAILGMSHKDIIRNFDEIVAFAEVEKFLDTPVKRFSSGMITRLGFAIAAHLDPDLLIVDEVLAVGDTQFQQKCLKKMNELGNHGRTILFVSHDVGSILTLCNKGILLEKGDLKTIGSIDSCLNEYLKTASFHSLEWKGDIGDEHIRFYNASLKVGNPLKEYFTQGEVPCLTLEYEVLKPHPDLIFGFGIWNQRNQLLARSHISDDREKHSYFTLQGKHTLSFPVDAGFFHEGDYLLKIDCFIHNRHKILSDEIQLKFPVYAPQKSTRFSHMHEKEGVFLEINGKNVLGEQMYPQIDILMATYNGTNYVAQQIESILQQSYPNIRLIIRDDGSTDETQSLIQSFANEYPEKVKLLPTDKNLGIRGNFSYLLEQSDAPYVMLSDQDDIWEKEKVALTILQMDIMEKKWGKEAPLLVHTDLKVVDNNARLIHPSFWQYAKLNPEKGLTLNRLLLQNVITGCTVMLNRSLLNTALPIPSECLMHDWWLGLVASAFGAIGYVKQPTMLYRQHGQNNLGAQKFSYFKGPKKWMNIQYNRAEGKAYDDKNLKQAETFQERYATRLSSQQANMLDAYVGMQKSTLFHEFHMIIKHGFYKQGGIRNIGILTGKMIKRAIKVTDRTIKKILGHNK